MRGHGFFPIFLAFLALLILAPAGAVLRSPMVRLIGRVDGMADATVFSPWTVFCPASAAPIPAIFTTRKVPPTARRAMRTIT